MGLIKKFIQFFKDSYYELAKAAWLGKKEAVGTTVVIVIFIIIMAIFVSIVDLFLGGIIGIIL
jgi:preprotein translocase subunit SecE